ncbi:MULTISPECIES: hypothetical protein [unclassified Lentimonas]|uniref:hypothetical protein n=1 Tax=unclassified Lentimonas TaxID=2630993 RepID=UPI001326B7EE|nr:MULTISPECIES: hypothetical protein [unclassified Lentimonas]CAA6676433.1 Unannotated [Lentimonas sp. CC4]CAA6685272.1 Unannotated [Lentimonas sp. CC6]CAA7075003.1 Unannotated [Lentimonas sp. CC4]CAA7171050.1 Unannotated [Lentimonas sp. CC21]CAA7180645.1 Unannotated [Lentimonas sp. CC8]
MKIVSPLLALLLLVSCQNSSVTELQSGIDRQWIGGGEYRVLVMSNAASPKIRTMLEDHMVESLQLEGVNASVSYTTLPSVTSMNVETMNSYLAGNAPAAILFMRIGNVQKTETSKKRSSSALTDELLGASAPGLWETNISTIVTNYLFVSGEREPVWMNAIQVDADVDHISSAVDKYITQEFEKMMEAGIVKHLKHPSIHP